MPDPFPRAQRTLVFVGGLHRSGTTMLADAVAAAPGAAGLVDTKVRMDEGQFLQDVYPVGAKLGGPTRWALDPRAYLTEADADRTPGAAERLWSGWSPYWDPAASTLVEKTPLNLTKTRWLQALFPGSKFVVITRHPITQSQAVRKWSLDVMRKQGYDFPTLVEHWLRAHEAFQRDVAKLEHVHVVRYEHLMTDPQPVVDELCEFLGLDVPLDAFAGSDAARFAAYGTQWQQAVEHGGPIAALRTAVGSSQIDRRKRIVEQLAFPVYARMVRRRFARRVDALGYDLDEMYDARRWTAGSAGD